MLLADERASILKYCRRMDADGLTVGTSGNLSVRVGDLVAVTPSGVDYATLTPPDVCVLDLDGGPVDARREPSSEVPMHLAVYRGTDARAVVHTHPLHATALSTLLDELPPIHYLVGLLGGPVRVAPYATYGSAELAEASVRALEGRSAVLLRNHGATTYGATLAEAYTRTTYLEWLCRLHHQASLLGTPSLIPPDELERVTAKLRTYGRHPGTRPPESAG